MAEILLVRHAEAYANKRNFVAHGNIDSPLTDKGKAQIPGMIQDLQDEHDIVPSTYKPYIMASEYTRAQQSAQLAGFRNIHISPLINESDVDWEIIAGTDVVGKHQAERWSPEADRERARSFIDQVSSGELSYQIYFTHGMFIAAVLLELELIHEGNIPNKFDDKRGFVPLQAAITKVTI